MPDIETELIEKVHEKKNIPIWVLRLKNNVTPAQFKRVLDALKSKYNAYYSKYKTTKGFVFTEKPDEAEVEAVVVEALQRKNGNGDDKPAPKKRGRPKKKTTQKKTPARKTTKRRSGVPDESVLEFEVPYRDGHQMSAILRQLKIKNSVSAPAEKATQTFRLENKEDFSLALSLRNAMMFEGAPRDHFTIIINTDDEDDVSNFQANLAAADIPYASLVLNEDTSRYFFTNIRDREKAEAIWAKIERGEEEGEAWELEIEHRYFNDLDKILERKGINFDEEPIGGGLTRLYFDTEEEADVAEKEYNKLIGEPEEEERIGWIVVWNVGDGIFNVQQSDGSKLLRSEINNITKYIEKTDNLLIFNHPQTGDKYVIEQRPTTQEDNAARIGDRYDIIREYVEEKPAAPPKPEELIPVKSVTIEWAEAGYEDELPKKFPDFYSATDFVRAYYEKYPDELQTTGAYDKHKFLVEWEDGESTSDRIDVSAKENNPLIWDNIYSHEGLLSFLFYAVHAYNDIGIWGEVIQEEATKDTANNMAEHLRTYDYQITQKDFNNTIDHFLPRVEYDGDIVKKTGIKILSRYELKSIIEAYLGDDWIDSLPEKGEKKAPVENTAKQKALARLRLMLMVEKEKQT